MHRKVCSFARHLAASSSRVGTPPHAAEKPRRLAMGLVMLVSGTLFLTLAPSAFASMQLVREWGIEGTSGGQFNASYDVEVAPSGDVYVADLNNHRMLTYSSSGAFLRTWGWGVADGSNAFQICTSSCQAGIPGAGDGQFNDPRRVAVDAGGNVYVSDSSNNRIEKFSSSGTFLSTWGWGVADGSNAFQICTSSCQAGIHGSGDGQLWTPQGVAVSSSGNVYVADWNNDRVQEFSSSGAFLRTWGWGVDDGSNALQICTSSCQAGISGAGDGQFDGPATLTIDSSGVFVADYFNHRIDKFSSSGTFLRTWGWGVDSGSNAFQICTSSCQRGLAGAGDGQFSGLSGLATDSSGNVYVADWINDRVQKFAGWGGFGTKWGSTGSGPGEFAAPDGVAVDSSGAIYVADSSNQRIEVFCNCTQTTITAGPSGVTNSVSASFSFASSEPGSSFECRRDSNQEADFQSCTSPKFYAPLADGSHTFEVRATSPGLGIDPTPASRTWTVDTLPPETTITSGPSGLTSDSTPTFAFSSSETGSTFQCKVDSDPYAACNSPKTTGSLADGMHTFYVRATDRASNTDTTPASRTFTVDVAAPQTTINSGPSGPTDDATPTFNFSSSEPGSFECRIDSGSYGSCSSPNTITSLADGSHTFDVRATDVYGLADPTPASRTFTVDTVPPDTTIGGGPTGASNDPTPTFSFTSSQPGSSFECKIDSGSYAACSSPNTTADLVDGPHTFSVLATDPAGNPDSTPATRSFTVRTVSVGLSGTTLVVTAATGTKDNLAITRPSASVLRVTDLPSGAYTGSGVHTGSGCTRSGDNAANCSGDIARIRVLSGDQADRVSNTTIVQSSLYGGDGDDTLSGGPSSDMLTGGAGADVMKGMNGNDQLFARDLTSDTTINCDGGATPGGADKADLDLLPKDPNSAVTNCETKTRH
jgi:RTX calcium-binding nonapeptide repeat (4 copies)/NHL repeat